MVEQLCEKSEKQMEYIDKLSKEKRPALFRNTSTKSKRGEERGSRVWLTLPRQASLNGKRAADDNSEEQDLEAQALRAASRQSLAHLLAPKPFTIPEGNESEAGGNDSKQFIKTVSRSSMSAILHRSSMLFSSAFQYKTRSSLMDEMPLFSFAMLKYIFWDVWDFTEPIRSSWDSLMLLTMIYIVFGTPYLIAFDIDTADIQSWICILDIVIVIIFCTDILLNFRTAYLGDDNEFVRDRRKIAIRYISLWFWLDLITSLPFNFILASVQNVQAARVTRLIRMWRLIKLFRLLKELNKISSKHIFNWLEDTMGRYNYSLASLALIAMSLLHWGACSFYFAASWNDFNEDTWVYHEDLVPNVWDEYTDAPYWKRYIYALYWATVTMTTVGYGDIVAYSIGEKFMAMFWVLIGVCMFAYLMGNITSMIARRDPAAAHVQEKKAYIDKFLEKRRVPLHLAQNVHSYYDYTIQREYMEEELDVVEGLPDRLQTLIILHLNSSFIEKVPMFQGKTSHFVVAIVKRLKLDFVLPGDAVVWQDEISHHMFFVADGQLDVRLFTKEACVEAQTLTIGKDGLSAALGSKSIDVRVRRERDIESIGETVMGVVERASQVFRRKKREIVIRSVPSVSQLNISRLPSKLLGEMTVGDGFGGLSCIHSEILPATAVASTSCELHTLETSDLDDVKGEFPELRDDVDSLGATCRLTSIYDYALAEVQAAEAAQEAMEEDMNRAQGKSSPGECSNRASNNTLRTSLAAIHKFGLLRDNAVAPLPQSKMAIASPPTLPPGLPGLQSNHNTDQVLSDLEGLVSEAQTIPPSPPAPLLPPLSSRD